MSRRRSLLGGLVLIALVLAPAPAPAEPQSAARHFIAAMASDALGALTAPGLSRRQRLDRFRALFRDRFAVATTGKWVLGRHWRKASPEERRQYLGLFEDLMVVSYVDRFAAYTGQSLRIVDSRAHGRSGAVVRSRIDRPAGGHPVRVDWRVATRDGAVKVVDVIVAGTSLSATLRSDFGSHIRRNGGSLAGLIAALREKTTRLQVAAGN